MLVAAYSSLGGHLGGVHYSVDVMSNRIVRAIARAHKISPALVLLRWIVQQGYVVVTGSASVSHMKSDLQIFDFELTTTEMDNLTAISELQDLTYRDDLYEQFARLTGMSNPPASPP